MGKAGALQMIPMIVQLLPALMRLAQRLADISCIAPLIIPILKSSPRLKQVKQTEGNFRVIFPTEEN